MTTVETAQDLTSLKDWAYRSSHAKDVTREHVEGETEWWCDCRDTDDEAFLQAVETSNCTHIVLGFEEYERYKSKTKKIVIWLENDEHLSVLPNDVSILTPNESVYLSAKKFGKTVGLHVTVKDLEAEFPRCIELCERGDDFVVIDIEHATYIPYELLIAKVQTKKTRVFRSIPIGDLQGIIHPIDQSLNAFATMEHGIGVVFRARNVEAIDDLSRRMQVRQRSKIGLVKAVVTDVVHTGLGHRVCVDTTSFMSAEEGMVIGSTGWGGLFVCSETHYLPHMNLREFRVNAGAVHSYIWGPGNSAMYLSEMRAGSEVLSVDLRGNARVVTVGRAKIERRPLINVRCRISLDQVSDEIRLAVEADRWIQQKVTPGNEKLADKELDYVYINVFLQNDWHVRVMGADGKVRHSATVTPGDEIMAHVDIPGRHTGIKISEHILER